MSTNVQWITSEEKGEVDTVEERSSFNKGHVRKVRESVELKGASVHFCGKKRKSDFNEDLQTPDMTDNKKRSSPFSLSDKRSGEDFIKDKDLVTDDTELVFDS